MNPTLLAAAAEALKNPWRVISGLKPLVLLGKEV